MKLDVISMLQMMLLIVFFAGILYCAFNIVKSKILKHQYSHLKSIYTKALDYTRSMTKKEYISFEKYDIWRYCVHS
jgi:hypothetical protein